MKTLKVTHMKNLFAMILLASTSMAAAETVFLNIPSESSSIPGQTIPTASQRECEKLMVKLAKEEGQNFYMSCSIIPQTI